MSALFIPSPVDASQWERVVRHAPDEGPFLAAEETLPQQLIRPWLGVCLGKLLTLVRRHGRQIIVPSSRSLRRGGSTGGTARDGITFLDSARCHPGLTDSPAARGLTGNKIISCQARNICCYRTMAKYALRAENTGMGSALAPPILHPEMLQADRNNLVNRGIVFVNFPQQKSMLSATRKHAVSALSGAASDHPAGSGPAGSVSRCVRAA